MGEKNVYQDQNRSFEERAADLVSRMTLEEKIMQVGNNAASIPRLDIPAYNYWGEASHGFFGPMEFQQMDVTSYPVCLAMSQSWDREKIKAVSRAIGEECRALHNEKGIELHMWCPTINLARDPRNGRSDENFGEDPFLAGELAASYIQGLQGEDETYLQAVATPKHFALNSSENNRHTGSSNVDEATMREYYTEVFRRAVEKGKPASIMTSYNRINGIPASVNDTLLTTLLREEWGFDGVVVSDCGAVADCYTNPMFLKNGNKSHYYCRSMEEASALSLIAGMDMSCGVEHKKALLKAVQEGLVSEDVIDRALIRIFTSRFRLGLFDDKEKVSFNQYGQEHIASEAMQQLSREMADDTIVLLKNEKNLLPLDKKKFKKLLVIGPNAIYRELGGYSAGQSILVDTNVNILALEGIRRETADSQIEVSYEKGWCSGREFQDGGFLGMLPGLSLDDMTIDILPEGGDFMELGMAFMQPPRHAVNDPDAKVDNEVLFARALEAAGKADAVIVIAGTDSTNASEEHDRETLALPYGQDEKIQQLLEANENTVVVLETLGAVTGKFMEKAHTLVNAHFAGQEQGTAIADILFGKVNPNAKLTATWYQDESELPHINDYGLKAQDTLDGKTRTYQYFDGKVLFPFGYGLSYTRFEYGEMRVEKDRYDANETMRVSVDVKNAGECDGAEIVQLYVRKLPQEKEKHNKPIRQLKGFEKVWLKAGESHTVTFEFPVNELRFFSNFYKKMVIESGVYEIEAGPSSAELPCRCQVQVSGKWDAKLHHIYAVADKYVYCSVEQGKVHVSAVLEDTQHLKPGEWEMDFVSSDEEVAVIDSSGIITAKEPGTATIIIHASYKGNQLTATLPVVVKK